MRCHGISATLKFNDAGEVSEICCMGLNERYGKVPVTPFYVVVSPAFDNNAIRSSWLSWIEENFHDRVPFWYVYTFKEASVITFLLGKEWYRWWDGDQSVVVEQVISFLNNYSIWTQNKVRFKGFWQALKALRVVHDFKLQTTAQQTYMLPDLVRILSHNVKIIREM